MLSIRNWFALVSTGVLALACAAQTGEEETELSEARTDSAEQALNPALVPLVTFYSAARGDYFTTTDAVWTCRYFRTCAQDPGYVVVGLQGYVHNAANPRPAGSTPLYHWFSPSRGDNFVTSDPNWAGAVGDVRLDHDGYRLHRIEGFIDVNDPGGSVPLVSHWNLALRDNAAVTPRVALTASWARFRTEGYLRGPGSTGGRLCLARQAPRFQDSPPWTAHGNMTNTWPAPNGLVTGDALRIGATGQTRIDFWGTHKNVAGEGPAGPSFPAPGAPAYSLIAQVTAGRMWVPGKGYYDANVWFPVGADSGCLEYDGQGTTPSARKLQLTINDDNLGDNAGGPAVTVRQYY